MNFISLASSSKGNAYIVEDSKSGEKLLIECGIPYAKLKKCLNHDLSNIVGCLVTHEHKDHALSASSLLRDGISVYTSYGTAATFKNGELANIIEEGDQFNVGGFEVLAFRTFHDAAEPLGFLVRHGEDMLYFATDTVNLNVFADGVTIYALEANFDRDILERNQYIVEKVKERTRRSHMEIGVLCEYIEKCDLSAAREIHLLHLSAACSNEREFIRRVQSVCGNVPVTACPV